MSIWSSRFGERGVNLAAENSFRLQINNASSSDFTINLFNLGGGANSQTSITTGTYSLENSLFVTELTNGILIAPITFEIAQGVTTLVSIPFIVGQTINDIMTAVNPIVNLQGQSGILTIQQTAGDLTGKLYDLVLTTPNITKVSFSGISQYSPTYTTTSYVTNNPLVTIDGTTNINFIQNSEIGNSYKIMSMGVYSNKPDQLLESINYFWRDVNGNLYRFGTDPTIDPYQANNASVQMIYVDDFQIHTNTQFQYTILKNNSVYLTFTYVQFGINDLREFSKIFYQQTRDIFLMDKKLLKKSRINSLYIE